MKIGETFDYFGRSLSFFDLDGNKIKIWEDYEYDTAAPAFQNNK